jgi:hypothetical protein
MYAGEWGEDVADQAHAGLLLEIDLNGTTFKDDAARASFAKALQSTKCRVRQLKMGWMRLGGAGGAAVGAGLATNTSLTSIYLEDNQLGEVAGAAIGTALQTNTTLTSINLGDNKLGEVAGAAIATALQTNTTLTSIDLHYNDSLPAATKEAIEAAVAKNKAAATAK